MSTRLIELVENLPKSRIVLVGDLMIDRYLYGNAERLSPEAPVPVLHFQHEELRLGGAGSVAADLAALNAEVRMVGVIGKDSAASQLKKLLADCGVKSDWLIESDHRTTISKVRLVGLAQHRHPQQMLRLDYEDIAPLPDELAKRVIEQVEKLLDGAAILCIEDYNKGLLTPAICKSIIDLAKSKNIPVIIDPAAISDYRKYAGATAIKLNRTETEKATGIKIDSPDEYPQAAQWLLDNLQLEAAIITLDKNGAYVATKDGLRRWLRTRERQVYDVTGAGDMVLAMTAVARAAGADWEETVALANIVGGLEVEKFGSIPIRPEEIVQELLAEVHQHIGKERSLEHLIPELKRHRATGKKIVFTNGCFDLIHLGHIKYFQFARKQGDLLVVGVNTDQCIRRLKGSKRPIINEHDRLRVLEELESIDYLVRFDEDTPLNLVEMIRPDVLVKGAEYSKEQVVGWEIVEGYGGRIELAPLVDGRSTTAVIERILEAYS